VSADDWKPCPRCFMTAKQHFVEHRDNDDSPLTYEEVRQLELLKDAYETGCPQDISDTDIEKGHLVTVEDKLRESDKFNSVDLLPSGGNFRPVEVRYEWSIEEDGAWFSLYAYCRNCGHEYEAEKR